MKNERNKPYVTIKFSKYAMLEFSKFMIKLAESPTANQFSRPDSINWKRHVFYGRSGKQFLENGTIKPYTKKERKPLLDDRILDPGHNTNPNNHRKEPEQSNNQLDNIRPSNNPNLLPNFTMAKPTKKNRLPQNDQNNS